MSTSSNSNTDASSFTSIVNDLQETFRVQTLFHNLESQLKVNPVLHILQSDELDPYFLKDLYHDVEKLIAEKIDKIKNLKFKEHVFNTINKVALPFNVTQCKQPKYIVFRNNQLEHLVERLQYQKYEIVSEDESINFSKEEEKEHQKHILDNGIKLQKLKEKHHYSYLSQKDCRKHFTYVNLHETKLIPVETRYFMDQLFYIFLQYLKQDGKVLSNDTYCNKSYYSMIYYLLYELKLPIKKFEVKTQPSEYSRGDEEYKSLHYILDSSFQYYPEIKQYINIIQKILDQDKNPYNLHFLRDYYDHSKPATCYFKNNINAFRKNYVEMLSLENQKLVEHNINLIINYDIEYQKLNEIREKTFQQLSVMTEEELLTLYRTTIRKLQEAKQKEKEKETQEEYAEKQKEREESDPPLWIYIHNHKDILVNGLYIKPDLDIKEYEKDIIQTIQMVNKIDSQDQCFQNSNSYMTFKIFPEIMEKYKNSYDLLAKLILKMMIM
jgi:hypothetical protein